MSSRFNGPNALTVLRIALSPVFLYLLLVLDLRLVALVAFWVAAITDYVDGWWARRDRIESDFGKLADPIADKALTGAAWIGLSMLGEIAWVATALILLREIGITLLRLRIARQQVVAADRGGKWKTTLQITTISVFLLVPAAWTLLDLPLQMLLWATVGFTLYTGFGYLRVLLPGRA